MAQNLDELVPPIPNLKLAEHAFVLTQDRCTDRHDSAREALMAGIEKDEMAPFLEKLLADPALDLKPDAGLLDRLKAKNQQELERLDNTLKDAKENLGEIEVSDALRARASYLSKIGDQDAALAAHEEALTKAVGIGSRIDQRLAMIRVGFFYADHAIVQKNIEATRELVEEGGDWDRRNRLKAYEGLHMLSIRNFKKGAELLLDVLSTFTATELLDYESFVTYCVLAGTIALERRDLKKKVIDAPEVIGVLPDVPTLKDFCDSLYKSEYVKFFQALATIEENHLFPSRVLAVHSRFYVREMRIKAYSQLLESYRSVTLASLASAFGVSESFIDSDLSRFIAAGRLNCSIDRVNGIVETNRPDAKNARYESVVRQGDVLLTAIQRLSRVIG